MDVYIYICIHIYVGHFTCYVYVTHMLCNHTSYVNGIYTGYVMLWYAMLWYAVIWYTMIWSDLLCYDLICYDLLWSALIWYDMIHIDIQYICIFIWYVYIYIYIYLPTYLSVCLSINLSIIWHNRKAMDIPQILTLAAQMRWGKWIVCEGRALPTLREVLWKTWVYDENIMKYHGISGFITKHGNMMGTSLNIMIIDHISIYLDNL